MWSIVQSICLITIVNIIVQFHCNMCTKSPVREIATIEGTCRHQRLTDYHNQWECGLFSKLFTISNTPPLWYMLFSVGNRIKKIQNKGMFVCLLCARVPSPAGWVCDASFQLSPKHTIHWNWRLGHCGWWCCAQLRLGTGWCCFGSRWSETPGPEAWRIHNQSWLLVRSLMLVVRIRGPGKKKEMRTFPWECDSQTQRTSQHTFPGSLFTFMCFRRELGCV